jgi:osmoprotectant transport system permease protein
MRTLLDALKWIATGHWSGSEGIPLRVAQHLELSLASVVIAAVIAIPIGLLIGHTRRGTFLAVSIANLGRSIPSFAVLVLLYLLILNVAPSFAFGFTPTVVALVLLAIPPILTNTYVGIQAVDADIVEAGRGMGMSGRDILFRLETPLAARLIMAGLRTAAVQVVATATLAALIGGGGLGRYIIDGQAQGDRAKLVAGAILVAVLAILTEVAFAWIERRVTPKALRREPDASGRAGIPPQVQTEAA